MGFGLGLGFGTMFGFRGEVRVRVRFWVRVRVLVWVRDMVRVRGKQLVEHLVVGRVEVGFGRHGLGPGSEHCMGSLRLRGDTGEI